MRQSVPTSVDILVNLPRLLDAFLPWTPTTGTTGPRRPPLAAPVAPVTQGIAADFPMQIVDAFEAGKFHRVPLVVGTNANEGATFIYSATKYLPLPAYDLAVAAIFGIQGADVLQQYKVSVVPPVNVSQDARVPLSTMLTDFWFRCASERLTAAVAKAGLPAFVYRCGGVARCGAPPPPGLIPPPPRLRARPQLRPRGQLRLDPGQVWASGRVRDGGVPCVRAAGGVR